MLRTVLILALLASAATALAADKATQPKQFLDRTVVTFPVAVNEYTLAETHYDPAQWVYGVTSKWAVNGAPSGLRLTVFVYPIGRDGEEQAVALQIADIESSMHGAVEQGFYADLTVGAREPFVVVAPEPTVLKKGEEQGADQSGERTDTDADDPKDLMPKPELRLEASDSSDPIAATLAASLRSANNHGLRQSFRFTQDGVPIRSLGYVFYRHLFAFKVRVSTPADSMDDATFEALADTATRNLVPRITVENYGQCGIISVSGPESQLKDNEKPDSSAMAQQLLLGIARIRTDNCATAEGENSGSEPRPGTRVEIVYPPDVWRSTE